MKKITLICLIAFIAAIDTVSAAPSTGAEDLDCDELLRIADHGLNKIMFVSDEDRIKFSSAQDFKENYCDVYPTHLKMATNYTKCLKSFSRSLMNLVAANVKKIHKAICLNPEKLAEAFTHVKCMDETTKEEFSKVGKMGVSLMSFVSELESVDDVIPAACCGVRVYIQRSIDKINSACESRTGPGTGKFLSVMIRNILGDVTDLICGKFPDNESCEKQIPELFNNVTLSIDQFKSYNHSFAYPTVKMLQRLDGLTI